MDSHNWAMGWARAPWRSFERVSGFARQAAKKVFVESLRHSHGVMRETRTSSVICFANATFPIGEGYPLPLQLFSESPTAAIPVIESVPPAYP